MTTASSLPPSPSLATTLPQLSSPMPTLLAMFNEAAAHVTKEDIEERESLLGGFADGSTNPLRMLLNL